jgi:hypothetical protein
MHEAWQKQNTEHRANPVSVTARRTGRLAPSHAFQRYELAFQQRFHLGRPALKGGALYAPIPQASSGEKAGKIKDACDTQVMFSRGKQQQYYKLRDVYHP